MRVKLGFIGTRRMTMVTLVMSAAGFFGEDGGAREAVVPGAKHRGRDPDGLEWWRGTPSPSRHLTFPG